MPKRGESRANANRRIRQEALREQLEAQGHVQHFIEILDKLRDLDDELDANQVTRLKAVLDNKKYLIDKYLPTEKYVETDMNIFGEVKEIAISDA